MNTNFLIFLIALSHTIVLGQAPFLKTIAWNSALGERFNQRIQPARDGNLWVMGSAADAQGTTNGGRILKLGLGGQILQSLRFKQDNGQEIFFLDMVEAPDGTRYCLGFTEESQIPSVVIKPALFILKFRADWALEWSHKLSGGISPSAWRSAMKLDERGYLYCYFHSTPVYLFYCVSPSGDLVWSQALQAAFNQVGSASWSGMFDLIPGGSDIFLVGFHSDLLQTHLVRLDKATGAFRSGAVLNGIYPFSFVALPSGHLLLQGTDGRSFDQFIVLMASDFTVQRAWELKGEPLTYRLLPGPKGSFILYGFSQSEARLVRFDLEGIPLKGGRFPGLTDTWLATKALYLPEKGLIALPSTPSPRSPNVGVLMLTDTNFIMPSCRPIPHCLRLQPISKRSEPFVPVFSAGIIEPANLQIVANPVVATLADYCGADFKTQGVFAAFSIPDTICSGERLDLEGLQNGGAEAWTWELPGGVPSNSQLADPGAIRFEQSGVFTLRQIVRSACLQDTFEQTLAVLATPTVALPPSQTFCRDTALTLVPRLENATDWQWQDNHPSLARRVNQSGLFRLQATNGGYCDAADSIALRILTLDSDFSLASPICTADSAVLTAPPNPPGSALFWDIKPLIQGINPQSGRIRLAFKEANTYEIALRVTNDLCKAETVQDLTVFTSPSVSLGGTVRVSPNRPLAIRPAVEPPNSSFVWADGWQELDRIVRDTGRYVLEVSVGTCSATDTLMVLPTLQVYQPNAFRLGSEANAYFTLYPNDGAQVESLTIFDRWGSLIFQGPGLPGWDGMENKGRVSNEGVYTYKARIKLAEGDWVEIAGDVTLLR